jgi:tRNA pseudouridine(55) synthase
MTHNVISQSDIARGLIDGLFVTYKRWGETPLQTLNRVREENPNLKNIPLSYAGRLDPLAEGVLLVLCGEANKSRNEYLGMEKEYECEVLFGLQTDSGDLLGLILNVEETEISEEDIKKSTSEFIGKQSFTYPVFSSKAVLGKPLFQWFKEGRIREIEIPKTDIEIKSMVVVSKTAVTADEVLEKVTLAVNLVTGDFRQDEILRKYKEVMCSQKFTLAMLKVSCTSGTYMRTLAEMIGQKCNAPALAYSIKRVKIGEFTFSL